MRNYLIIVRQALKRSAISTEEDAESKYWKLWSESNNYQPTVRREFYAQQTDRLETHGFGNNRNRFSFHSFYASIRSGFELSVHRNVAYLLHSSKADAVCEGFLIMKDRVGLKANS